MPVVLGTGTKGIYSKSISERNKPHVSYNLIYDAYKDTHYLTADQVIMITVACNAVWHYWSLSDTANIKLLHINMSHFSTIHW